MREGGGWCGDTEDEGREEEESGSREELEQRLYHFICKLLGQSACDPPNTGWSKVCEGTNTSCLVWAQSPSHLSLLPPPSLHPSSLTPPLLPHSSPFGCRPPHNCVFVSQSSQQKTQHLFNVLRNIIRVLLCVECVWVCVGVGVGGACLSLTSSSKLVFHLLLCLCCLLL